MAESPEETPSMNGGRSLKLFDWLLLPLLSLCNCRRKDANCAQVVNKGTVQAVPIDEQPDGPPSTECAIEGNNTRSAPDIRVPAPDEPPGIGKWMELYDNGDGWSETRCCIYSEFQSTAPATDRTPVTDLSIDSDFEAPIHTAGSITEHDCSSIDQLKLSDLPLLALLTICGHLRPKDPHETSSSSCGYETRCEGLYNFRNTCRTFAYAVNIFFEKPATLPTIEDVKFTFEEDRIAVQVWMQTINYMMHPLRANRAVFDAVPHRGRTFIDARFKVGSLEEIQFATQSLCGSVERLHISRFQEAIGLDDVLKLSNNCTFKTLNCTGYNLTDAMGSLIVALIREKSNAEVIITVNNSDITNAPTFLAQLYSSSKMMGFTQSTANQLLFLGKSTAFWQQWLLQKLPDGCKIKCDGVEFTAQTDLAGERLQRLEWRK